MTTLTLSAKETEMLVAVMSEIGEIPSNVSSVCSLFPCVVPSLGSGLVSFWCCTCLFFRSCQVNVMVSDAS